MQKMKKLRQFTGLITAIGGEKKTTTANTLKLPTNN